MGQMVLTVGFEHRGASAPGFERKRSFDVSPSRSRMEDFIYSLNRNLYMVQIEKVKNEAII